MKLTDELKKQIEEAKTVEEKKAIIMQSGIELTDEELEAVNGGLFKNPYGYCSGFKCKNCGYEGYVFVKKDANHIQKLEHTCKYDTYEGDMHMFYTIGNVKICCENCAHNTGSIFCDIW